MTEPQRRCTILFCTEMQEQNTQDGAVSAACTPICHARAIQPPARLLLHAGPAMLTMFAHSPGRQHFMHL